MKSLTLYKENRTDKKYEKELPEFIREFIEWEEENPQVKRYDYAVALGQFVAVGLNSVPENVPFTDEELNAIIRELKIQRAGTIKVEIRGRVQSDIMDWVISHPSVCENGESRRSYFPDDAPTEFYPYKLPNILEGNYKDGRILVGIPDDGYLEVWKEILVDCIDDWDSHLDSEGSDWLIIDPRTDERLTSVSYARKACDKLRSKVKELGEPE